MHGKTSLVFHKGEEIFKDIKNPIEAMRYHSLVIDRQTLPRDLEVTAYTEEGVIMGVRHKMYLYMAYSFIQSLF